MELTLSAPTELGKQTEGSSPASIKQMAMRALQSLNKTQFGVIADVGAGRGELTHLVAPYAQTVLMLDDFEEKNRPRNAQFVKTDLNNSWNVPDNSLDVVLALEVIEHLENPRHFVREIKRILKPHGYGFISTPHNLNFFSRLNFLIRKENRFFSDNCYPAHISMLTKKDLSRILSENDLKELGFFYNYTDSIPLINVDIAWQSAAFSSSIGVLFQKI
jgi:2-polyprenyl-3-methyl-5-hydroxy-6-metoxy-1,4-benzoquinol methylase